MGSTRWAARDRSHDGGTDFTIGPDATVTISVPGVGALQTVSSLDAFIEWAQVAFRRQVPHRCAIFGVGVRHSLGFSVQRLLPLDMPPEFLDVIRGPSGTVVCPVVYDWFRMRCLQTFDASKPGRLEHSAWLTAFKRQRFGIQLAHGHASDDEQSVSFMSLYADAPASRSALLTLEEYVPAIASCLMRLLLGACMPECALGKDSALTRREMEVIDWIAVGKTNWEIGQILGISELTVKSHLQRLFSKTGTNSRAQLVAKASALRRKW